MKNLPVEVSDDYIEDMFAVADTNNDGKLGYQVHWNQWINLKLREDYEIKNQSKWGCPPLAQLLSLSIFSFWERENEVVFYFQN